jgi:signal transduction histidine kinase
MPVTDNATPAFSVVRFFARVPAVVWLPVVSALLLLGFSVSHATAIEDLLLLGVIGGVLALGHALMRTRGRRLLAEDQAERLRSETTLIARVGDCEQRRKSLSEFAQLAAHVAHEVRNPLNAIMLNGELLDEEVRRCNCAGAGEAAGLIASIQREAERLRHLTDEYLAFARPPRPSVGHHSLNAVVDDLTHLVRAEASRQGVTVVTEMSRDCPCAMFDPQQLKQAALNLVRNSLQAMPNGGRLTISTSVLKDGRVSLAIGDSGPGVPFEQRCVVFEPFYTSKPTGTGLGLPLAAHIARDLGGDIELGDSPDRGALFTILLPTPAAGTTPCSCGVGPVHEPPSAGASS